MKSLSTRISFLSAAFCVSVAANIFLGIRCFSSNENVDSPNDIKPLAPANAAKPPESLPNVSINEQDISIPAMVLNPGAGKTLTVNWQYFSSYSQTLSLTLNGPIIGDDISKFITITPALDNMQITTSYRNIEINGKFIPETLYSIKLAPGLTGMVNNVETKLEDEFNYSFMTPPRPTEANLAVNGMFFQLHGKNRKLPFSITNVAELKFNVSQFYDNQLGQLSKSWTYDWNSYTKDIAEKSVNFTHIPRNQINTYALNVDELFPKNKPGVYILNTTSYSGKKTYGNSNENIVIITDMGVQAFEDSEKYSLIVRSLKENTPLSGVKISLLSQKKQILTSATTNENGIAEIKKPLLSDKNDEYGIFLLEKGDDKSFFNISSHRVYTQKSSDKSYPNGKLNAAIYPNRTICAPGEDIDAYIVVRTTDNVEIPADQPIEIRVQDPLSNVVFKKNIQLNGENIIAVNIPIPNEYYTGSYTITASMPQSDSNVSINEQQYGYAKFLVANYTPDTFKISLQAPWRLASVNEELTLTGSADYFFGERVTKGEAFLYLSVSNEQFKSNKFKDFEFTPFDAAKLNFSLNKTEPINEKGEFSFTPLLTGVTANKSFFAPLSYYCSVTVKTPTGNSVTSYKNVICDTADFYLGLRQSSNKNEFEYIAVTGKDELAANFAPELEYELSRLEWRYSAIGNNNAVKYEWNEIPVDTKTGKISTSNQSHGTFQLPYSTAGKYQLKLKSSDQKANTILTFYN